MDQLVAAIQRVGPEWSSVSATSLDEMVRAATKARHEIQGGRIRALHGHSWHVESVNPAASPPAVLFHGTSLDAWATIRETGLAPMGRRFVHLALDVEMALAVGKRKTPAPVIVSVDARAAHEGGAAFYEASGDVWLADAVPAGFLSLLDE